MDFSCNPLREKGREKAEEVIMQKWIWGIIKWFLFRLEPETAHRIAANLLKSTGLLGSLPLRICGGVTAGALPAQSRNILGMDFGSRVGLAAGFDKDAELVRSLPALGFGFAEIGTVTPRPQPGNDRPRLFRDPSRQALFNRMGFNGQGAELVARHLAAAKPALSSDFKVGVNIGKNKDTPLEDAASDYIKAIGPFEGLADYVVVNVSSPNTPGLRSLQTIEGLKPILEGVKTVLSGWKITPPLLLKIAPEITGEGLSQLIQDVERLGIHGWVLTNTLSGTIQQGGREFSGGWSGGPLTVEARQRLIEARAATKLPIISVGGILSPEEAVERCRLGADLVQVYSGWVYGGPCFPVAVRRALAKAGY
jgi:dihydroorotate dehydrogenase